MGSSKHSSKNKIVSWKDTFFWYFMTFGALGALVTCAPPVNWRWNRMNPHLGDRFVADRRIGLFTISNQFSTAVVWFKMKSTMCRYSDDLHAPNIGKILLTVGMQAMEMKLAKDGKKNYIKGGTWLGCFSWQECKQATMARCTDYGTLSAVGVFAGLMMLVTAISAGMGLVCMGKESHVKKKKKKIEAEWNTCITGMVAFLTCSFATGIWVGVTKMYFDSFRNMMYYPYPYVSVGSFMAGGCNFLLFWAMFCGWRRQSYLHEDKHKHHGDDDDGGGGSGSDGGGHHSKHHGGGDDGGAVVHHHHHHGDSGGGDPPPEDSGGPPPDDGPPPEEHHHHHHHHHKHHKHH